MDTRSLIETPVAVAEEFRRATAPSLAGLEGLYSYVAPESGDVNLGAARRLTHAPWTVFALVPERSVLASVRALVERGAVGDDADRGRGTGFRLLLL